MFELKSCIEGTVGRELSDTELVDELGRQAAHLSAAECHQVLLIAELDRREIWADGGTRSCAHWLNWRCGTSITTAREQLRVGRALSGLPLIREAFASGEISYSKARAVTRIATRETEETLLMWAKWATASQLELIVRSYRRADPDEGKVALERHERRFLRTYSDSDGMVVIQARLSPEDAGVVLAAIERARRTIEEDASHVSAETSDEPSRAVDREPEVTPDAPWLVSAGHELTKADALVAVCRSVLGHGLKETEDVSPVSVVLHVDERVLEDPTAEGCSYIEEIGAVSSHTARRLACDAGVMRLLYKDDGTVEQKGRTQAIPRAIRRAVMARDMGCRWPGCTQRRFVDCHHVVFWSNGGETKVSNLICLCRYHHRLVHEGGYRLEMSASGKLRLWKPDGTEILVIAPSPRAFGPGIGEEHRAGGFLADGDTLVCGYADPFDLHDAVEWLYRANHAKDPPSPGVA